MPSRCIRKLYKRFGPTLPLAPGRVRRCNLSFGRTHLAAPRVGHRFLPRLFNSRARRIVNTFLTRSSSQRFILGPFYSARHGIRTLFTKGASRTSLQVGGKLFTVTGRILFLHSPHRPSGFRPHVSTDRSCLCHRLDTSSRCTFSRLC